MSTGFVQFRGKGFWSYDPYLEHALALLAGSIPVGSETWLLDAGEHWMLQSSGVFSGWIHPHLDEFLTTDDRISVIFAVIHTATQRADITSEASGTLCLIKSLLEGKITTDPASALTYMIDGRRPYEWRSGAQIRFPPAESN